jgi:hypothetical protein
LALQCPKPKDRQDAAFWALATEHGLKDFDLLATN